MILQRSDRVVGWILAAAVAAQGVGLIVAARPAAAETTQIALVTAALAAATAMTWRVRMRLNHRVDMLLVMGAVGGLGMLLGGWLDTWLASSDMATHGAHGGHGARSAWAMVPTWMTGLMLAAAIPASALWTRCAVLARTGWRRWLSTHVVGNGVMVVAMVWVGHWLGHPLGSLVGSMAVGHHAAMVLGMMVGMELGMFAGETALGLAPWREWRWSEDWDDILERARSPERTAT
jgi:hypothetical protein